jgi:hypothetical protein
MGADSKIDKVYISPVSSAVDIKSGVEHEMAFRIIW